MYNGTTRQLALQKSVLCSKCEGIGGKKVGCYYFIRNTSHKARQETQIKLCHMFINQKSKLDSGFSFSAEVPFDLSIHVADGDVHVQCMGASAKIINDSDSLALSCW